MYLFRILEPTDSDVEKNEAAGQHYTDSPVYFTRLASLDHWRRTLLCPLQFHTKHWWIVVLIVGTFSALKQIIVGGVSYWTSTCHILYKTLLSLTAMFVGVYKCAVPLVGRTANSHG